MGLGARGDRKEILKANWIDGCSEVEQESLEGGARRTSKNVSLHWGRRRRRRGKKSCHKAKGKGV